MSYQNSWGKFLARQLQFRCKLCPDGIGELADISCADAWYSQDGHPDFSEKPGRSLILCRTKVGQEIMTDAVKTGYITTETFCLQDIALIQPFQAMRKRLVASRLLAMFITGVPLPKYRGFYLLQNAVAVTLKDNWSSFTGMISRIQKKPQYKQSFIYRLLAPIKAIRIKMRSLKQP